MSDPDTMRLRSDAVVWRQVGDEVIALSLDGAEYVSPSESATELWAMLAEGTTLTELAAALERRWGIEPAAARRDAGAFVDQLRARGFLD